MSITLRWVEDAGKTQLRALLTAYLSELNQYGDVDLEYQYFDSYWTDKDRWPFFIETVAGIAGFVLLNRWSASGQGTDFAVAEFCILPEYRGIGIGKEAVSELLSCRPGIWEISVLPANTPARAFWQRALRAPVVQDVELIETEGELIYRFSVLQ